MFLRNSFGTILLIGLLVVSFSMPAIAGTKGRLIVTVTDSKGDPLKGVKINLVSKNAATRSYDIETNKKGIASISGVEPDMYHALAEKEGFQYLEGDIKLRVGVKVKVEWEMKTIEEARTAQIAAKREEMTAEELAELDAKDAHNRGMVAYQANNLDEAKVQFEKAIALFPDVHYFDYLLLGQFAFNAKDVDAAIPYLEKAKELDVDKQSVTDTLRLLGACYMIKEDYAKVREVWGPYVETDPDPSILFNLANLEVRDEKFDEAIKWLNICCEKNAEYADAFSLLGDIYIQKGDYPNALSTYEKYLALLEKDANASPEAVKTAKDTVKVLKEMKGKR